MFKVQGTKFAKPSAEELCKHKVIKKSGRYTMRRAFFTLFLAAIFSLGSIGTARADLFDRGCGLIYDSDQNITWYDFTYVASGWADANAWADQLVHAGYDDWRLPRMPPNPNYNQTCSVNPPDTADRGWNKTTSEMGHLFYIELGNLGYYSPNVACDTVQDGWGLNNTGPFTNLQTSCAYWQGPADDSRHWNFSFGSGGQGTADDTACGYGIAVRDGDVGTLTPPVANAGLDQVVFDKVTLDGGASSDPGGTIISYQWNLEHWENAAYSRTAEGVTPMVSNLEKGFYYVTLTVTNNNGCTAANTALLAAAGTCRGGAVVVPTFLLLGE
jgi:hypothetical protein